MKQVTNLTSMLKSYDLDSFDENGRRKSVHLAPGESASLKNDDAEARQLQAAISRGEIAIVDAKTSKTESGGSAKTDKKKTSKLKNKEEK